MKKNAKIMRRYNDASSAPSSGCSIPLIRLSILMVIGCEHLGAWDGRGTCYGVSLRSLARAARA
eukprot:3092979-Pyramimonas_sp.AAC.1